jgi:hypothetical protein
MPNKLHRVSWAFEHSSFIRHSRFVIQTIRIHPLQPRFVLLNICVKISDEKSLDMLPSI